MKIFIETQNSIMKISGKYITNSSLREEIEAMKEGSTITILI